METIKNPRARDNLNKYCITFSVWTVWSVSDKIYNARTRARIRPAIDSDIKRNSVFFLILFDCLLFCWAWLNSINDRLVSRKFVSLQTECIERKVRADGVRKK